MLKVSLLILLLNHKLVFAKFQHFTLLILDTLDILLYNKQSIMRITPAFWRMGGK